MMIDESSYMDFQRTVLRVPFFPRSNGFFSPRVVLMDDGMTEMSRSSCLHSNFFTKLLLLYYYCCPPILQLSSSIFLGPCS